MADLYINLTLSKWGRGQVIAQATANAGDMARDVCLQLRSFVDLLQSGELPIDLVRDSVESFLAEAFADKDLSTLSRSYGDTAPDGEDWSLHISAISPAERRRRDAFLEEMFPDGLAAKHVPERAVMTRDGLIRLTRMDDEMGLMD